ASIEEPAPKAAPSSAVNNATLPSEPNTPDRRRPSTTTETNFISSFPELCTHRRGRRYETPPPHRPLALVLSLHRTAHGAEDAPLQHDKHGDHRHQRHHRPGCKPAHVRTGHAGQVRDPQGDRELVMAGEHHQGPDEAIPHGD